MSVLNVEIEITENSQGADVNQRQQFLRGLRVTLLEAIENLRDVAHPATLPMKRPDVEARKARKESARDKVSKLLSLSQAVEALRLGTR